MNKLFHVTAPIRTDEQLDKLTENLNRLVRLATEVSAKAHEAANIATTTQRDFMKRSKIEA